MGEVRPFGDGIRLIPASQSSESAPPFDVLSRGFFMSAN